MSIFDTINVLFRPRIKIEDVFTPAKAADINYIDRPGIDSLLSSEMSTPGKQIVVYGHSGSGKTSSVLNLLKKNKYRYIKTHCESSTTFEQLILNAFDALNVFVVSGGSFKRTNTISSKLEAEYRTIKETINTQTSTERCETYTRLLPPQLTPQKLAQFLGEMEVVWLIEDFHKVPHKEKVRIADVIKIFVDNANDYSTSKIICIGACDSAHELIKLDPNLKTRVSEISVDLLKDEEIRKIITHGFKLLNVVPVNSLVEKLVYYSDRLGAFAHQMCMDICKGENIIKTSYKQRKIGDQSFQYAVNGFIQQHSGTLKNIYDSAIKNELGWYVLKTFSRTSRTDMDKLSFQMICERVNKGKNKFSKEVIKAKLDELMEPPYSIIYYNSDSEQYALSSPFWHRFLRLQDNLEISKKELGKKQKTNQNLSLKKYVIKTQKYEIVDNSMAELIENLKKILEE